MAVLMRSGLSTEMKPRATTMPGLLLYKMTWRAPLYLCVHILSAPTMDSVVMMRGLTGRFIFRCPHCIRVR